MGFTIRHRQDHIKYGRKDKRAQLITGLSHREECNCDCNQTFILLDKHHPYVREG